LQSKQLPAHQTVLSSNKSDALKKHNTQKGFSDLEISGDQTGQINASGKVFTYENPMFIAGSNTNLVESRSANKNRVEQKPVSDKFKSFNPLSNVKDKSQVVKSSRSREQSSVEGDGGKQPVDSSVDVSNPQENPLLENIYREHSQSVSLPSQLASSSVNPLSRDKRRPQVSKPSSSREQSSVEGDGRKKLVDSAVDVSKAQENPLLENIHSENSESASLPSQSASFSPPASGNVGKQSDQQRAAHQTNFNTLGQLDSVRQSWDVIAYDNPMYSALDNKNLVKPKSAQFGLKPLSFGSSHPLSLDNRSSQVSKLSALNKVKSGVKRGQDNDVPVVEEANGDGGQQKGSDTQDLGSHARALSFKDIYPDKSVSAQKNSQFVESNYSKLSKNLRQLHITFQSFVAFISDMSIAAQKRFLEYLEQMFPAKRSKLSESQESSVAKQIIEQVDPLSKAQFDKVLEELKLISPNDSDGASLNTSNLPTKEKSVGVKPLPGQDSVEQLYEGEKNFDQLPLKDQHEILTNKGIKIIG
jgi:hypothetical protein